MPRNVNAFVFYAALFLAASTFALGFVIARVTVPDRVVRVEVLAPVKPATPPPVAYVASVKSRAFHRVGCEWAAKIKPSNRVTFATLEDAKQGGRRMCQRCEAGD